MQLILVLIALATSVLPAAAQTPLQKCKAVIDSLERLRCYDAIQEPVAPPAQAPAAPAPAPQPPAPAPAAKSAAPGKSTAQPEDPLITKAKESVLSQLRDPSSARFQNVKVRTVRGKQAVCGLVNAKNEMGYMSGPQPFAFDGEQAYLIVYGVGPANSTNQDVYTLSAAIGERLKAYTRLCR